MAQPSAIGWWSHDDCTWITTLSARPPLLRGVNHVALVTADTDRLHAFYREVFDASVFADQRHEGVRVSFVDVGPFTRLNVFELPDRRVPGHRAPMFGRGPLDHLGLEAASPAAFDEVRRRLIDRRATDGFVTDFGTDLSFFFTDPDGLECEVLLHRPGATAADLRPPGTPAAGYEATGQRR